jgi:hypothetical protein
MIEYIVQAKKRFPDAWKQAEGFRCDPDMPHWEPFCFLPIAGWIAIASGGNNPTLDDIGEAGKLAGLGSWRMTQGIFKFDDILKNELIKTPFSGALPCDVLTRLPHWCCYIPHEFNYLNREAVGFFVFIEQDMNNGSIELRFLIDDGSYDALTTAVIHLGDWTITEAIEKYSRIASKNSQGTFKAPSSFIEQSSHDINQLVNLVLYLCSEEPDYGPLQPSVPAAKKTKKGLRFFPAPKPIVYNVGDGIGQIIKNNLGTGTKHSLPHTKRAHVRKAHWHGYWTGSKTETQIPRKFIYKWLPPVLVGA